MKTQETKWRLKCSNMHNQFNIQCLLSTMSNILWVDWRALFHDEMAAIRPHYRPALSIWLTAQQTGKKRDHDLETGGSLRAPDLCLARPLEIQLHHSEVSAPSTSAHTHRSITSNSLDTQLMAKGPFKVAHLNPARSPPPPPPQIPLSLPPRPPTPTPAAAAGRRRRTPPPPPIPIMPYLWPPGSP